MKHATVARINPDIKRDENPSRWVSGTQIPACSAVKNVHARISMVKFLPQDTQMKMHRVQ